MPSALFYEVFFSRGPQTWPKPAGDTVVWSAQMGMRRVKVCSINSHLRISSGSLWWGLKSWFDRSHFTHRHQENSQPLPALRFCSLTWQNTSQSSDTMGTRLRMLISAVILASWVLSASGAHYHSHRHHRLEDVALTGESDVRAQRNKVNFVFLFHD